MKYFVTFCTMDPEIGANPMWHSCLLLSKENETLKKLEVVDNWGFYGLPTTGEQDGLIRKLKLQIGLDVDFTGNHGMLRHEETRFLDAGHGLHGVTFELTQEQFELLQKKCTTMDSEQQSAIKEVVDSLKLERKDPKKTRIYPYEQYSLVIYELERKKALEEKRESRLKPFDFQLSFDLSGLNLKKSHTCKSQGLTLLNGILSQEQIARLTEHGQHPTIPRYSGNTEKLFLHSTGPLLQHEKSNGDVVYYRDAKDPDVKLYWTLPPQEIEVLSEETSKNFLVDEEYCDEVKVVISRLQRLEWLFRNAPLPEKYHQYKEDLLEELVDLYQSFSVIDTKQDKQKISGFQGYALSLFSIPRGEHEKSLQSKIKQAKMIFNMLYMAIIDHWEIGEELLKPMSIVPVEQESMTNSESYHTPPETIASYLCLEDKIALCEIVGRHYCEEDVMEHSEVEYFNLQKRA